MIKKGQWILLPANLVLSNRNMLLSPLGVAPQRERRPGKSAIIISSSSVMTLSNYVQPSPCSLVVPYSVSFKILLDPTRA
jgi:hypothetical protein